jgi:hypothetical protein
MTPATRLCTGLILTTTLGAALAAPPAAPNPITTEKHRAKNIQRVFMWWIPGDERLGVAEGRRYVMI